MTDNFVALLLGTFLAETVKNAAKGSANWLKDNGKSLFYEDFIQLNLGELATPEQITKQLEDKPEIIPLIEQKITASPDFVKELFEKLKNELKNDSSAKNTFNVKNIGTVITDSHAPITINNKFE